MKLSNRLKNISQHVSEAPHGSREFSRLTRLQDRTAGRIAKALNRDDKELRQELGASGFYDRRQGRTK